jgi:hypothetical protein
VVEGSRRVTFLPCQSSRRIARCPSRRRQQTDLLSDSPYSTAINLGMSNLKNHATCDRPGIRPSLSQAVNVGGKAPEKREPSLAMRKRRIDLKSCPSQEKTRRGWRKSVACGIPPRERGVYCANEEGPCCNKSIRQKPGTSSGLVRRSRRWMSPATLRPPTTAESAGGGFAPSTPKMRPGIIARWSRAM